MSWPLGIYAAVLAGLSPRVAVLLGLILLFVADRRFRFQAVLPLMTPVLMIGGMTAGVFTPTEGSVAASAWAMLLGFVWYRSLSFRAFVKVCLDTVETTATVMFRRRPSPSWCRCSCPSR